MHPRHHHPEESTLPGDWGHAGGRGSPSRTYQGTGRCSQGQGLCNSGWRRSWLGNLGNLMGQGGNMRRLAHSWGAAGSDLSCPSSSHTSPQIILSFPEAFCAHKSHAKHSVHFIISLSLATTVMGKHCKESQGTGVETEAQRDGTGREQCNLVTQLPPTVPTLPPVPISCLLSHTDLLLFKCAERSPGSPHAQSSLPAPFPERPPRPCDASVSRASPDSKLSARGYSFHHVIRSRFL